MATPSQFAADARAYLGLSPDQVVPDIVEVIQRGGYNYHEADLDDAFSAVSTWAESCEYLICYNTRHQFGQAYKRFTLAHELGHQLMHAKTLHGQYGLVSSQGLNPKDPLEIEANEFAAHFLMPQRAFLSMADKLPYTSDNIRKLSGHFGVSEQSTAMHYVNLTDLACTMIVSDASGTTKYECRSARMKEILGFVEYVYRTKVPEISLTHDWMHGRRTEELASANLIDWMPDARKDIAVEESVIHTPDNLYLTLLTLAKVDLDDETHDDSEGF